MAYVQGGTMKVKNVVLGFSLLVTMIQLPVFSMEPDEAPAPESLIYIKNGSDYPVRVSVGPAYPSSIALYPGQIMEFPLKHVPTITASTYGRVSHVLTGLVAQLDVAKLLQEHPEYLAKNCLVQITYKTGSTSSSWRLLKLASYLFTRGAWSLTFAPVDYEKDLAQSGSNGLYSEVLYEKIRGKPADATPEPIARDAAFIWSMFPRAATKIVGNEIVYPFNILGLDIGGLAATDCQLTKWGDLLYSSVRKKYSAITSPAIWNAVHMIIADSVGSLKHGDYYAVRQPDLPATLLHIPRSDSPGLAQEPAFPVDIIDQLKGKVGEDTAAQALIGQLEQVARLRGWTGLVKNLSPVPPAPPAPPSMQGLVSPGAYQEKAVKKFLSDFAEKRPEEQLLLDKVVKEIFEKIDELKIDSEQAFRLKYAALDKLRLVEQEKHAVSDLAKIREFMSPVMIKLATADRNPMQSLQDWISLLAKVDRDKAFEYFRMDEQPLSAGVSRSHETTRLSRTFDDALKATDQKVRSST